MDPNAMALQILPGISLAAVICMAFWMGVQYQKIAALEAAFKGRSFEVLENRIGAVEEDLNDIKTSLHELRDSVNDIRIALIQKVTA